MNVESQLKNVTEYLIKMCEKKDNVIKGIEEEFQESVNGISDDFGKKHQIHILNIYKSKCIDKYKIQIYFKQEPLFLQKLKHEIHYIKGGTQTMVNFGDVILYWNGFGENYHE
jgi:hypothetical protein